MIKFNNNLEKELIPYLKFPNKQNLHNIHIDRFMIFRQGCQETSFAFKKYNDDNQQPSDTITTGAGIYFVDELSQRKYSKEYLELLKCVSLLGIWSRNETRERIRFYEDNNIKLMNATSEIIEPYYYFSNNNNILRNIIRNKRILVVSSHKKSIEHQLPFLDKIDPSGTRTVGVLTKLDLMNDAGDVIRYLENKVSKDLQLKHGYFAIKNRNSVEKDTLSVEEGLAKESLYFQNHSLLSKDTLKTRVGTPSLKRYLAHLLTNAMKMSLPAIQAGINKELSEVETGLNNLGDALPEGEEAKISYMHTLLVNYAREFTSCIKDRGSSASTGRNIRDLLVKCREKLEENNAFKLEKRVSDGQLNEIVLNSEGNHMSFPYPPVEILERCLQDVKIRPIYDLYEPLQTSNNQITEELVKLVSELIENSAIGRFPELRNIIRQETIQSVIIPNSTSSSQLLEELVMMQENYIWTDDEGFKQSLLAFGKEDYTKNILPALRKLLAQYIDSITVHLSDTAPKSIMLHLVNKCTSNLYSTIYPKLATENASKLLTEDTEVERKRKNLIALRTELKTALTTIERLN